MRHYECVCAQCGIRRQLAFHTEPFPEIGDNFLFVCTSCGEETAHTRVLTKRAAAELRRRQQEEALRDSMIKQCAEHHFRCRFLHQSVIITTALSDWCFDYHESRITLYHESTVKINFATGNYAKAHVQFASRKITPQEVIEYIAKHDARKAESPEST